MFDREGPLDRQDLDVKDRADRCLRAGRPGEALPLYTTLLRKVEIVGAGTYESWLEGALAAYQALGRSREAGYVLIALRRFADAERCFAPESFPHEWALCAAGQGRHREASRVLALAGYTALAALALESAGDLVGARQGWEALLAQERLRNAPYEAALARFNLGQILRRLSEEEAARRELGRTQQALEQLADGFETEGSLDRAFECFGVLLRMGKDTGSFENVAEGYLNAIRLLSGSDHRHGSALEYYEDFLAFAAEAGEFHAAARLADEAADFSAQRGLVYERHYRQRAAQLWQDAAAAQSRQGAPTETVENALVAAVDAAAAAKDPPQVGRIYGALSDLPLPPARRARYAALATRHGSSGPSPSPAPGFPEHFRQKVAYAEVWRQDLVDWELAGRPTAVLVQLVAEGLELAASERHALRALLLCAEDRFSLEDPITASELAVALGQVRAYEVLRPLQAMAGHGAPRVRAAAIASAARIPHVRSFAVVSQGFADPDEAVRVEARRALRSMGFRGGLSHLVRLLREASDELLRHAAVEAIADIDTAESGLVLVDLVRYESGPLAELAARRLRRSRSSELLLLLRRVADSERGPARALLQDIVAG